MAEVGALKAAEQVGRRRKVSECRRRAVVPCVFFFFFCSFVYDLFLIPSIRHHDAPRSPSAETIFSKQKERVSLQVSVKLHFFEIGHFFLLFFFFLSKKTKGEKAIVATRGKKMQKKKQTSVQAESTYC